MADHAPNGNRKSRRLLAPHPWPIRPDSGAEGPLFYLSWPGWELYLTRRLSVTRDPDGPEPLLLPGRLDPEADFAALDQLARRAGELGAGFVNLDRRTPESVPALAEALTRYRPGGPASEAAEPSGPLLDDRSYLALWAITEYQARQGEGLLAEAAARERAMWAALKGEEPAAAPSSNSSSPAGEPDRRTAYAWRCWRRLAAPLLTPSDLIVPTAPVPSADEY